jgi:hypothetical protein
VGLFLSSHQASPSTWSPCRARQPTAVATLSPRMAFEADHLLHSDNTAAVRSTASQPRATIPIRRTEPPPRQTTSSSRHGVRRGRLPELLSGTEPHPRRPGQVHTDAGRPGEHNLHLLSHRGPSSAEVQPRLSAGRTAAAQPNWSSVTDHSVSAASMLPPPSSVSAPSALQASKPLVPTSAPSPPSGCPMSAAIFPKQVNASTDNCCRTVLAPPSEALR